MDYLVVGPDGKEYGPANVDALKEWVSQDRLRPDSTVKDFATGRIMKAQEIPGLFSNLPPVQTAANPYSSVPSANAPLPKSYYQTVPLKDNDDTGPLWGVLLRCGGALLVFFLLHGLGLIFSIYALIYAVQAKSSGNKYGVICLVAAIVTLIIVGIGWTMRLSGSRL